MFTVRLEQALANLRNLPPSAWKVREGSEGGAQDSFPKSNTCLSRLGNALLQPLGYCGRYWQNLQSSKNNPFLQKICAFVLIIFAAIPAILGSLIKCIANPSLDKEGNWHKWELALNGAQSNWCRSVGLGEPEVPHGEILEKISRSLHDIARKEPEFPRCGIITSRKGVAGAPFIPHIDFCLRSYGVQRPNGNEFVRNMMNSFLPRNPPSIEFKQIKVLGDLLLGIKSGTAEDYRLIREHLAASTRIELEVHPVIGSLDLKIYY